VATGGGGGEMIVLEECFEARGGAMTGLGGRGGAEGGTGVTKMIGDSLQKTEIQTIQDWSKTSQIKY